MTADTFVVYNTVLIYIAFTLVHILVNGILMRTTRAKLNAMFVKYQQDIDSIADSANEELRMVHKHVLLQGKATKQ